MIQVAIELRVLNYAEQNKNEMKLAILFKLKTS